VVVARTWPGVEREMSAAGFQCWVGQAAGTCHCKLDLAAVLIVEVPADRVFCSSILQLMELVWLSSV